MRVGEILAHAIREPDLSDSASASCSRSRTIKAPLPCQPIDGIYANRPLPQVWSLNPSSQIAAHPSPPDDPRLLRPRHDLTAPARFQFPGRRTARYSRVE